MSVRSFTDQPVSNETIKSVLKRSARAPSGGNVQPWRMVVLNESKMAEFRSLMDEIIAQGADQPLEAPEYHVYPPKLKDPYRTSRFEVGEDMYALLGISREDKPARLKWLENNFRFFNAPAAAFCFVETIMGPPQWADLGMYLQSTMLLFQEEGLDTCAQEFWARYPNTVRKFCDLDENWMLFCGLAIGYKDDDHPVNQLHSKRRNSGEWLTFL